MAKYDAIVVGSGANGGWAAKELCEAGMKVAVLEAGTKLDPSTEFTEHVQPWELPLRGRQDPRNEALAARPIQRKCYACGETNAEFFMDDSKNPISTPDDKPFWWIQGNKVGGRTLMWARQSYRFSDYDFKAASHDGYGVDWPISYADLAPYYDRVERFIGVSGRAEGMAVLPDGQFLPPMPFSCGEEVLKEAIDGMGDRRMTIGRVAVLTRPHAGRAACHYCGPCHRGCLTGSYFSSPVSTLPAAERTGNLTLITDAMAREVTLNAAGLANGVLYVDKLTGQEERVDAPVVVLAASTLASTRILLLSGGQSRPEGLGNSSGVLGKYLMDHVFGVGASGAFGPRAGAKAEVAERPNGIYVPRFRNLETKQDDFIRGYGYQGGENVTVWEQAYAQKGFGADFKTAVRGNTQSRLSLSGFAEMLPYEHNTVSLDPEMKDAWGVPVLHVDCVHGDNERAMIQDAVAQAEEMLERAGCTDIRTDVDQNPPGFAIHEVGTARMGDDPKTSVLNAFQQSHDVKNLFVMDGSAYPSIGCVNPTLTMMALTLRSCEYLIAESKRGNLA